MTDPKSLIADIEALVAACGDSLRAAASDTEVEDARVEYLGRKGRLAQAMSAMAKLPGPDRPAVGQAANRVKEALTALLDERLAALAQARVQAELASFDPTMPGRAPWLGSLHPVTLAMQQICDTFRGLGYDIVMGPEIETDFYNFAALNFPDEHPARDMQDTLYIQEKILLRTHTSPLQIRTMLERTPPIAVVMPGKVYRRDSDLTHTPMFHQIEGLLVDRKVSMGHLRGTLTAFVRQIFGLDTNVRFRPSFFPFTEPSAEVDISCFLCKGAGHVDGVPCRVCKTTGWVEILGCGMVDPNVFASVGLDPEVYTGFAFGMGVERVAMLKYGIGDLRQFFENDVRFLNQFT